MREPGVTEKIMLDGVIVGSAGLASAGEDCAHVLLEEWMTGLVPSLSTVAATGLHTVLR